MKTIAILSPSNDSYSETFITAHKKLIKGNKFFFYGGMVPTKLEGKKWPISFLAVLVKKIIGRFKNEKLWYEKSVLKKALKKVKAEVVLAEYAPLASECLSVCRDLDIPLIVHFHGYDASVNSVIEKYENYKELFEYASKVIVVSKKMCEMITEMGCSRSKIELNTYGPNDEFTKVNCLFSDKQFISLGRFVDKKAPYYTVLAFSKVLNVHPEGKLIMGGDGYLLNATKNLVKYLGIEENVDFPGILSPTVYQNELSKSWGFVQHSIRANDGDMEGTPVSIIEASAAGVPVISTYHAGIPDVIKDGVTGFLCDEHDVETMSQNMIRIFDDRNNAIVMGEEGKKFIHNNFSMSKHIGKINEVINDVIK